MSRFRRGKKYREAGKNKAFDKHGFKEAWFKSEQYETKGTRRSPKIVGCICFLWATLDCGHTGQLKKAKWQLGQQSWAAIGAMQVLRVPRRDPTQRSLQSDPFGQKDFEIKCAAVHLQQTQNSLGRSFHRTPQPEMP